MQQHQKLFTPIRPPRTFEEVSRKIKELIFGGALKPGDRLPPEVELANQFNVGRQTIREALRILEQSGFISVRKGATGGPIIENTILKTINDLFLDAFRMEKIPLHDLTIARLEIEMVALKHAFDNAQREHIENLQQNIIRARMKAEENIIATEENIQFHKLLAEASRNQILVIAVGSIMAIVSDLLSRSAYDLERSRGVDGHSQAILKAKKTIEYHQNILNAIIEKRRDQAFTLLEEHILEVKNRIQPFVE